jgi:hypothetical protein
MRTKISFTLNPCRSIRGRSWQPDTETTKQPSFPGWVLLIVMMLLLVVPLAAYSKGGPPAGKGSGGGTTVVVDQVDFGDIFGDLIHIYRHEVTGQPIFAQRWIEMPAELPGYGWGYCAIVYTNEAENSVQIPFLPYSCDLDPLYSDLVVEVDYFGRLNASRTMERNQRMHFNEVISNINQAVRLKLDPVGRLMLQYCEVWELNEDEVLVCTSTSWATIDSPMESMALYTRLLKYGHFGTDPDEEDLWWHGDPALYTDGEVPTHPSLDAADYGKFMDAGLGHLLPDGSCWDGDTFIKSCANPESLTSGDFNSSGIYLGAAASKTGWITVDLLQYLNRFLRITQTTDTASATLDTLPALYLDCYDEGLNGEPDVEEGDLDDLVYGDCSEPLAVDLDNKPPGYEFFTNIQERFMDFGASGYTRDTHLLDATAPVILLNSVAIEQGTADMGLQAVLTASPYGFMTVNSEPLIEWIDIPNTLEWSGVDFDYGSNIANYVIGSNDAARSIEFIHNYEIPEDLYCKYDPDGPLCYPPPPIQ